MAVLGASSLQIDSATLGSQSGSAPMYACRAWINFNGTAGNVASRANGNVSSISRASTGEYTLVFSTAMVDSNYAVTAMVRFTSGGSVSIGGDTGNATWQQTNSVNLQVLNSSNSVADALYANVAIFR